MPDSDNTMTAAEFQRKYGRGASPSPPSRNAGNANSAGNANDAPKADLVDNLVEMPDYETVDAFLGIDPGTTTGFALWERKRAKGKRLQKTLDASFVEAMKMILTGTLESKLSGSSGVVVGHDHVCFVVEDNTGESVFEYARSQMRGRGINYKLAFARSIGMADGYTRAIIEALRATPGKPYSTVAMPSPKKSGIFPVSKWDQETFQRVTGSDENTNQHKRDAARIACAAYPELLLNA